MEQFYNILHDMRVALLGIFFLHQHHLCLCQDGAS